MKTPALLSILLALVCGGCKCDSGGAAAKGTSSGGVRFVTKPGVEFYCWQEGGEWLFALLDITNRTKPEQEIKAAPVKLADLESPFAGYPKAQRILWYVTRFSRPDSSIIRQAQAAAEKHQLRLILVE